jgi:hypothetical protein
MFAAQTQRAARTPKKPVQQTTVARHRTPALQLEITPGNGFKNQPLSVQQIATPEVRNCAFYGRFERF